MSEEQKPVAGNRRPINVSPQIVDTPGEQVFYANAASMRISPEEIMLQHGLVNHNDPTQSPSIARVYMSPGHAKRLMLMLNETISHYENLFGNIHANPEDLITAEGRKRLGMSEK